MIPTSHPSSGSQVQEMFSRIAARYDRLNRLMTWGRDRAWRRETIAEIRLAPGERFLDVGCGTGDLALEALRQQPDADIIACDFTAAMLRLARSRPGAGQVAWVLADATHLPFAHGSIDALASGFLLRNLVDLGAGLSEQARVLKPGGRFAALDTTPPQIHVLAPFVRLYLARVIPALGRMFADDVEAYRYLPATTQGFLPPEKLAATLRSAGFTGLRWARRMFGTIAIHWAMKRAGPVSEREGSKPL